MVLARQLGGGLKGNRELLISYCCCDGGGLIGLLFKFEFQVSTT